MRTKRKTRSGRASLCPIQETPKSSTTIGLRFLICITESMEAIFSLKKDFAVSRCWTPLRYAPHQDRKSGSFEGRRCDPGGRGHPELTTARRFLGPGTHVGPEPRRGRAKRDLRCSYTATKGRAGGKRAVEHWPVLAAVIAPRWGAWCGDGPLPRALPMG